MAYSFAKSDLFDFINSHGYDTREHGKEIEFRLCPYCNGGKSGKDLFTFSVNADTGAFNCFRSSCDRHGHFVELCRDFSFPLSFDTQRSFRPLPQPTPYTTPDDIVTRYFAGRGIGTDIVERYQIRLHKSKRNIIVFPFFDEQGLLQTVKYRNIAFRKGDSGGKEWFERATKPILFGMNRCPDRERLIITEGQIDSMSVAQAGYANCVSVPGGCNSFSWWSHCEQFVNSFRAVVVFGDFERGRRTLVDEICTRARTKVLAVRICDYLDAKDANEILVRYGAGAVKACIDNAERPAIGGIVDIADVKPLDLNDIPRIYTGIKGVDRYTGGLVMGSVVLLSGARGSGKSTLASQFICSALEQNESVFAYSGELPNAFFQSWLYAQLAGRRNLLEKINRFGMPEYSLPEWTEKRISDWLRGRMLLFDNTFLPDSGTERETLLSLIERVVCSRGVRLVVIDNLMTAMSEAEPEAGTDLYQRQSRFVGELKRIASRYAVCIVLVAHDRKNTAGSHATADDVSGSADVTNKVDCVLHYTRVTPADGTEHNAELTILKNRLYGILQTDVNAIRLRYHFGSRRVADAGTAEDSVRYGWETAEQITFSKEELPWT